jgi:hypothetical protein
MTALEIALDPFGTQHATVDRKVLPGFKPDHSIVFDLELDAALHAAETAMRLDESIRRFTSLPSPRRSVVEMGTVLLYQVRQWVRKNRHRH